MTTVTDPALVVLALLVVLAMSGTSSVAGALGWVALIGVLVVGVPSVVIWYLVHTGRVTDHRLVVRSHRTLPTAVALVCAAVCLGLLRHFHAPVALSAAVMCLLVGTLVAGLVTLRWKISAHSACAASAATICFFRFGLRSGLLLGLVALAAAWSRVRLGRHSVAQVVGGLALGVFACLIYPRLSS